nr:replication-relaxation family protein [Nocardioides flavescens]
MRSVDQYRLLTTKHLQRLHFDAAHPTPLAAARACSRSLVRLKDLGVLRSLDRRIGGVRAGSAGFVWFLGPAGDRLLTALHDEASGRRRNYREPSRHFVDHTLAVTELAVQAIEAGRTGAMEVLNIETEPASWQQSLSPHGTRAWLKPDLRLVTVTAEEEFHYFIESDLASEHLPVIVRQCEAYEAFRASGRYQAAHGLFPAVLWVVPTEARAAALRAAVRRTRAKPGRGLPQSSERRLDPQLFTVCTADEYAAVIRGDHLPINPPGGQEGEAP